MSLKARTCPQEEFRRIQSYYPQLASTGCTRSFCQSGRMAHTDEPRLGNDQDLKTVEAEAIDFLHQLHRDSVIKDDATLEERISTALDELRRTSVVQPRTDATESKTLAVTWHQTTEELEHGLRLSWKHARKCIMRSEYSYLKLHDIRYVKTSKEMGQVLIKGMCEAFNGGDIQPTVFVFPPKSPNRPGPMVWSQQFLAFAGYRQPDGSILGDPMNAYLTESIISLGWEPPTIRTRWDLLPLVTMADGDEPYISPIPESLFPLVQIRHPNPQHSLAFEKLGLRWVPAPALSQLGFDIGGVQYTATPFIGWFMDAEIGVRDLADSFRYDVLPSVVSALNLLQPGQELDELPQWERLALLSRAQTELTFAVHWSFMDSGVRMSDSLTASAMYTNFDDQHLAKHGFRLPADPYWLAPPQGSIVPVWHRGGAPNYQPKPMICRLKESPIKIWKRLRNEQHGVVAKTNEANAVTRVSDNGVCYANGYVDPCNDMMLAQSTFTNRHASAPKIRVFYCSSGTTAQRLAIKLEQRLHIITDQANGFSAIMPATKLNDFDPKDVSRGDLIFIIASSAGRGDVPSNGQAVLQKYRSSGKVKAIDASFCIFGNGNSSYAANCNGAAFKLKAAMHNLGLSSAMPLFQADTLKEDPPWRQFKTWLAHLEVQYGSNVESREELLAEQSENSTGLLLAQLSPAKVISVHMPKDGDIRRLALDVGRLEYSHMSHVDVFVPLSDDGVDELLLMVRLTGDELLTLNEGQVSTRQLFSLVDPDKPFTSLKWAASLGLNLTSEEEIKLLQTPMKNSIKDLPVGWQAKAKRGSLSDFMMALPTRRSRTFSTASSQLYWNLQNMGSVLELTMQTHPGGLVTDLFLSKARRGDRIFVRIRHGPGAHLVNDHKPLIAFTTGSGIAPLRGLLQARCAIATDGLAASKMMQLNMWKMNRGNSISLFLGFKPGDADIIAETTHEALALELVDMLHMTPSNPERSRAQDQIFKEGVASQIRTKIRDEGASVFVCASKEAADDFARNLEAIVGVKSIREVLGEKWVEEVYVFAEV